MTLWRLAAIVVALSLPLAAEDNGIVDVPSKHSVDQTVERLKDMLRSKGITLFAVVGTFATNAGQ